MLEREVAIVGGGIVGLAHAVEAHRQGWSVVVFERLPRAIGASIRNFGMVWPIGQPAGRAFARAMRSREIYLRLSAEAGFWADPLGSVHVARHEDELACLHEFVAASAGSGLDAEVIQAEDAHVRYPSLRREGLLGALVSRTEVCVDPFEVVPKVTAWLSSRPGVEMVSGCAVRSVRRGTLTLADGREVSARRIFVCSGDDIETLYPEVLRQGPLTRCKLQMMRTGVQPGGWRLGMHVAAGSTLRHYPAFRSLPSLESVRERFSRTHPDFDRWGIHVLASQTREGAVTIGDSHEYGEVLDPFNRDEIDALILDYLQDFLSVPSLKIAERWSGQYLKRTDGMMEFVREVEPGVWVVTGLGGNGMTLSFGLAQEVMACAEAGGTWEDTPSEPVRARVASPSLDRG